jgi:D-alanine-D-alanine ligase
MATGLDVALLANLKKNAPHVPGEAGDLWADLDSENTIEALTQAIRLGGHNVVFYEGDLSLPDKLRQNRPDICFNLCEGHWGDSREAQVPALLEMLQIPYTGSKVMALSLALDKSMTKRLLSWHELPTPAWQTIERVGEPLDEDLHFPLFVKPSREGTGMGVSAQSICHNEDELNRQVSIIHEKYKQPALVEQFIEGREVTVGMVGNLVGPVARRLPPNEDDPRITFGLHFLPPLEIDLTPFAEEGGVYSNRLKSEIPEQLNYVCPAPLGADQVSQLNWLAAAVFRVTACLDVARVDFRLDKHEGDKPYILEINPLPGLNPEISDLCIEAKAIGISHAELVNMILDAAIKRYGVQSLRSYHIV